ncbi:MAG TPA: Rrf2 family transcriptional regulator [Candidatus Krumholzibacteria bacterium]|nr:Rrf2 family transcriptional regulator [Candidatus Krumholzibacteria bacterium]HPD72304.1 Rrf2 family transcriptional regulator [Candidatus Krumholzibacteria bacterium]HRY40764.1 Rrf2 family transcriptional regulator [Candidatus Krumholzibacteria bacterium]
MKVNTRVRYGLRAILRIAEGYGGAPVSITTISEEQEISGKYLEQVVSPLRRAGLLESVKGVKGGYVLARSPRDITLWDVIQALDTHPHLVECVEDPAVCARSDGCVAHQVWTLLDSRLRDFWCGFTVADLLGAAGSGDRPVALEV